MTEIEAIQILSPSPALENMAEGGRYVYCIAPESRLVRLGPVGIDGREVYTLAHRDLAALVPDCLPQPYQPQASHVAAAWALAHHGVVDAAWRRWGSVLPLAFNTVVVPGEKSAEDNLRQWLEKEYDSLMNKLKVLEGKEEYVVNVFWNPELVINAIRASDPEILRLEEEISSRASGQAYMYRQILEKALRKQVETKMAGEIKEICALVKRHSEGTRFEKTKNGQDGSQMLLNLSCMVSPLKYEGLKAELEKMAAREGFRLRLGGPLPPYSFC